MRRTLYAIAALALITTAACSKKDEDIDNVPDKGSVRFKNISVGNDLYDIYLDDFKLGDIYGGDSATYDRITAGTHRVKALQRGNIVDTPKLRQQIVIVAKDTVVIFSFP